MPRQRADQNEQLKSGFNQKWTLNSYDKSYGDQFGCVIRYHRNLYNLSVKEHKVNNLYSLEAAKLISGIILNDIVMHKK